MKLRCFSTGRPWLLSVPVISSDLRESLYHMPQAR